MPSQCEVAGRNPAAVGTLHVRRLHLSSVDRFTPIFTKVVKTRPSLQGEDRSDNETQRWA